MATDKDRRESLGARLNDRVRRLYTASVVIPQWDALLQECTSDEFEPQAPPFVIGGSHPEFPREIQIQTHTYCNAECVMCPYPAASEVMPMGRMSVNLYEEIVEFPRSQVSDPENRG